LSGFVNHLTICRIIHVKDWKDCLPAIVTSVGDKHITCTIFGPLHTALSGWILHGFENDEWHWPNECADTKEVTPPADH